jgi:peptidoglycan/LPS O-acetylase OafA/YrhL
MVAMAKVEDAHRMWRTLPGILGNVVVLLVVVAVAVLNITEGEWLYVGLAALVIVGFGVVPAMRAHEAGALYFTQDRSRSAKEK